MVKFPELKDKLGLEILLKDTHEGINKGKWLTQDITLITKSPRFIRFVKILFNIFPGDRFKKIRAHNAAKSFSSLCSMHKEWIDQSISQKACTILDLLKEKTKESGKKALYSLEIEKAKKQIQALIIEPPLENSPPQNKKPSTANVILTAETQDFESLLETENLVIDLKLTPEQENKIKTAIETSQSIEKVIFSPSAAKENDSLVKFVKSKKNVKLIIDEELAPGSKYFYLKNRYSSRVLSKENVDTMLAQLQPKIEQVECLDLGTSITQEQEKKLAELILKAPKLDRFFITLLYACRGNSLLPALAQKKLTSVTSLGCDEWIKTLTNSIPTLKELSIIDSSYSHLSEDGIKELEKFSELETFGLCDPFHFKKNLATLAQTLLKLTQLQKISLGRDRHFLKVYANALEYNSKVPSLYLQYCEDFVEPLKMLADKRCTIDEIYITFVLDDESDPLPTLTLFPLKKLQMRGKNLTHEDYKKLEVMTTMEELRIHYPCNGGEYETIEKLLKKLPNLKKVVFYSSLGMHLNYSGATTYSIHTKGNSLLPHEQKKLQETFPKLKIHAKRAH